MAIAKIKSTYSLDPGTIGALQELARRWGVSKSEALRRAIRASAGERSEELVPALGELDRLQSSLALDAAGAQLWVDALRDERRSAARRLESSAR